VLPSKGKTPVKAEKEKEVKAAPIAQSTAAPAASSDYSRLSLKDLKDKLRERGLPVSGNKAELVTRLSA
jgi:SAP domain